MPISQSAHGQFLDHEGMGAHLISFQQTDEFFLAFVEVVDPHRGVDEDHVRSRRLREAT